MRPTRRANTISCEDGTEATVRDGEDGWVIVDTDYYGEDEDTDNNIAGPVTYTVD